MRRLVVKARRARRVSPKKPTASQLSYRKKRSDKLKWIAHEERLERLQRRGIR